jgi:hypothetical protein
MTLSDPTEAGERITRNRPHESRASWKARGQFLPTGMSKRSSQKFAPAFRRSAASFSANSASSRRSDGIAVGKGSKRLAYRKIVPVEFAQWHSRMRNFGRDEHGENACGHRDDPGEVRPRCTVAR